MHYNPPYLNSPPRTTAAAKLLFQGTLSEPRLFSNLLKVFFVPEIFDYESNNADDNEESANAHIAVMRLQQLLSVFLQAYSMVLSNKYQQVILDSIEHAVADLTVLCRDEVAAVTVLPKLANHLLCMCETQKAIDNTSSSYAACCARLAAVMSREALKLGNSKLEKATIKELIKVLVSLSPKTWLTPDTAASMYKVTKCISRNCILDKAIKKSLDSFSCACAKEAVAFNALTSQVEHVEQENMDDSVAYAVYELEEQKKLQGNILYSYAPGIADLVELIAEDEDSDIEAAAAVATEDDCVADDSDLEEKDDDDEEEDSVRIKARAVSKVPKSASGTTMKQREVQDDADVLPPPAPFEELAESIKEKPTRKRATTTKPAAVGKTKKAVSEAKAITPAAAASTQTKLKTTRAKSAVTPAAASRSRRTQVAKVYTEDDDTGDLDTEIDMENRNPQASRIA